MSIAFHTGVSGMNAFQEKLNITGNNLANANTVGYKK
ncbi:MAG: flagellar basal body protein, partial [Oscillospiraceae bacterium]